MNKEKQKEILVLILCLLIGFALRFYTFEQKSLWLDEVYTFNDSRDDLRGQIRFYEENPTFLHPPLFFILTHFFYPFEKPERDLRIIPLIFGILSIPMIYFLARSFSPYIALPCSVSLTFMAYHISLSQDGRSYSLLMFIAMVGLYFFMKYFRTSRKRYLMVASLFFAILFYTSYSSVIFITLSQILWFYRPIKEYKEPFLSSFLTFNGLIFLFCLPWIVFVIYYYKGQPIAEEIPYAKDIVSLWSIANGILHDWVPYAPLMICSGILLILFPILSRNKKNAIILLSILVLPIIGLYLFCNLFNFRHFVASRYFISFLPLFFISIYLSLHTIEFRFEILKRFLRLRLLFVILFLVSNIIILPLYYRSEKQDFRGLVTYLDGEIKDNDLIILSTVAYFPGILHYFGVSPEGRHYSIPYRRISEDDIEYRISLISENKKFSVSYSKKYWLQYALDRNRLWLVVNKITAEKEKDNPACTLKGYFDGSFLTFTKFPTDDSMYLFLYDPNSPKEKGIDISIE
jgi:hypothetical protein